MKPTLDCESFLLFQSVGNIGKLSVVKIEGVSSASLAGVNAKVLAAWRIRELILPDQGKRIDDEPIRTLDKLLVLKQGLLKSRKLVEIPERMPRYILTERFKGQREGSVGMEAGGLNSPMYQLSDDGLDVQHGCRSNAVYPKKRASDRGYPPWEGDGLRNSNTLFELRVIFLR